MRPHRTGFDVSTQDAPRLQVKGANGAGRSPGTLDVECASVGFGQVPAV